MAHDAYGKKILRQATSDAVELLGPAVQIDYGTSHPARIDGAVGDVAIELEARVGKQVRGAVLDLICHPLLLVIMPVEHVGKAVPEQCKNVLARFVRKGHFQVVVLKGHGHDEKPREDVEIVADALSDSPLRTMCVRRAVASGQATTGSCSRPEAEAGGGRA